MLKQGHKEAIRQSEALTGYGNTVVRLLQSYAPDNLGYYARCKRAAILSDWVQGIPIESIEDRYTTTAYRGEIGYGDIRQFADATRFHLRSAYQIISVMFLGEGRRKIQ